MSYATDDEIRELRECWVNNATLDKLIAERKLLRAALRRIVEAYDETDQSCPVYVEAAIDDARKLLGDR